MQTNNNCEVVDVWVSHVAKSASCILKLIFLPHSSCPTTLFTTRTASIPRSQYYLRGTREVATGFCGHLGTFNLLLVTQRIINRSSNTTSSDLHTHNLEINHTSPTALGTTPVLQSILQVGGSLNTHLLTDRN